MKQRAGVGNHEQGGGGPRASTVGSWRVLVGGGGGVGKLNNLCISPKLLGNPGEA